MGRIPRYRRRPLRPDDQRLVASRDEAEDGRSSGRRSSNGRVAARAAAAATERERSRIRPGTGHSRSEFVANHDTFNDLMKESSRLPPRRSSNSSSRRSRRRSSSLSSPLSLLLLLSTLLLLPLLLPTTTTLLPFVTANHVKLKPDAEFLNQFDETLAVKIKSPTDVQISPDGTMMLVTSKDGKLWVIDSNDSSGSDFIDPNLDHNDIEPKLALYINKICTNVERGLSGVAFHPQFGSTNRWVYLYYTYDKYNDCDASGSVNDGPINRFSRFAMRDDNTLSLDDEEVFFDTPIMPYGAHNSGCIAFGSDGMLYVSVGDGSGGISKTNGDGILYPQALDMLLGKIIRLTEDGDIPPDNPYVNDRSQRCNKSGWTDGGHKFKCLEIFAYGLRNPWRFALDPNIPPNDGVRMFINDVGRHTWESIREGGSYPRRATVNFGIESAGQTLAGANYGYPDREGPCKKKMDRDCKPPNKNLGWTDPIHWFHHDSEDGGAVTGGAFYPNDDADSAELNGGGAGWPESWQDSYLYANYAMGGIYRIKEGSDGCPYPECDPPVSDYMSSTQVLSGLRRVVAMKFGPLKGGGQALYVVTRGDTGGDGDEGIYRISYIGGEGATSNRNPTARIATNVTPLGFPPFKIKFDGTESFDPDGPASAGDDGANSDIATSDAVVDAIAAATGAGLTYEWDLDGDGTIDSTKAKPQFTYTTPGTYYVTLTVTDPEGGSDTAELRVDVEAEPPRPSIMSPLDGTTFAVGDVITLRASAATGNKAGFNRIDGAEDIYDDGGAADGVTDDDDDDGYYDFTWEVRLHHDTSGGKSHYHPVLEPTPGNNFVLPGDAPPPPSIGDDAVSSYLVVLLTATDSRTGLSSTTSTVLKPRVVQVELDSEPVDGLVLTVDLDGAEVEVVTPARFETWENHEFEVRASSQTIDAGDSDGDNGGVDGGGGGGSYSFVGFDGTDDKSMTYVASAPAASTAANDATAPPPIVAQFKTLSPVVQINDLSDGMTFAVGDPLTLSGSATNGDGGSPLPDSALTWTVHLSNGTHHRRPILPPTAGNDIEIEGGMPPPENFDLAATEGIHLEVVLSATSALGLTSTVSVELWPRLVDVTFDTDPTGLHLILDGDMVRTPKEITTWEGHGFEVEAPSQRMAEEDEGGELEDDFVGEDDYDDEEEEEGMMLAFSTYVWRSWSDGGTQTHEFVTPPAPPAVGQEGEGSHYVEADFVRLLSDGGPYDAAAMASEGGDDTDAKRAAVIGSTIIIAVGAAGIAMVLIFVGWTMRRRGLGAAAAAGAEGIVDKDGAEVQIMPVDTLEMHKSNSSADESSSSAEMHESSVETADLVVKDGGDGGTPMSASSLAVGSYDEADVTSDRDGAGYIL